MIRALLAAALALALAGPAAAHRLNVFAAVEEGEVVIETRFSTGRVPVAGEVIVEDAAGELVATHALAPDGTARFALDVEAAEGGLSITVRTGDDHEGYWLLTPADIAAGGSGS